MTTSTRKPRKPGQVINRVKEREARDAAAAKRPRHCTWDDYAEQCRVDVEPVDVTTLSKAQLATAPQRQAAWLLAQRRRFEMARSLRQTYVAALGGAKTIIVGEDDDL